MLQEICRRKRVKAVVLNVHITDSRQIKKVNRKYLNSTRDTDVISFDLSDSFEPLRHFDLIVNAEMAQKKADRFGHKFESELALYVIHGLLHNLGYDDIEPEKAKKMHRMEDKILIEFGYGAAYSRGRART